MFPLLPDSSWEFGDTFVPSEAAGPLVFSTNVTSEEFSVKRLPGSRTIRDLMIASGKGSFQRLHRTFFDVCVRRRPLRMSMTLKTEEEVTRECDADGC